MKELVTNSWTRSLQETHNLRQVVDILQEMRIHQVHLGMKAEDLAAGRMSKCHLAHWEEGSKRMLLPQMTEVAGAETLDYTHGLQED